jgi:hypothetical protein
MVTDSIGNPLMDGFPDRTHLYDRLVPYLIGSRPVVLFGWAARTSRGAIHARPRASRAVRFIVVVAGGWLGPVPYSLIFV